MSLSIVRRVLGLLVLAAAVVYGAGVGLTGSVDLTHFAAAQTQGNVPGHVLGNASQSDLWRKARRGEAFLLSNPEMGTAVLIQSQGENWRALRNGKISTYGGYLLAAAVAAVLVFFLVRGRVKVDHPTGRMVLRFSMLERMSHWAVAILFVLLGVTGLVILYGKYVLAPVIGQEGFAAIASASLQAHNLLGPLFALAIVVMIVVFIKDNFGNGRDLQWLLKGGFLFRGNVPSGKFNFGEKTWFWIAAFGGIAISASGLYLDLPGILEGTRETQQLANIVHAVAALIMLAATIGHIYLGTIGVDGTLDGMITGEVDEAWAREHHGYWADDVIGKADVSAGGHRQGAPAE